MTAVLLPAAERVAVPWKNGGGVTREIAAWPPGSDFDTFHWRVSMAQVSEDGPFSTFRGVDRILTVLEGGLRLTIEDADVFDLSPQSAPLAFDGGAPASARLTGGEVLDLNVMTRRGVATATVDRLRSPAELGPLPGARLVFALADGLRVQAGGEVHVLGRHDGLLARSDIRVEATDVSKALVVSLVEL